MMRVLTVLSFIAGSGSLIAGCDAFLLHQHRLLQHRHYHHHPRTESLIQHHQHRRRHLIRSHISTCSTSAQDKRHTTAMRSSKSPRPFAYISSHGAGSMYRRPPSREYGRLLRWPRSSFTPLILGATSGNKDESKDGNSSRGVAAEVEILSRQAKLLVSVMIDLIGMSSYVLPGMGELTDLGWAPISSALIYYLYGNSVFAGLAFVEEIIPGFDFIPTATIAWFLTNSDFGENVTRVADKRTGSSGKAPTPPMPPMPPREASGADGEGRTVVNRDEMRAGVVVDVESD